MVRSFITAFAFVVIVTAIAGVVGTGLGGLIGVLFTRNSEKIVSLLLSFAGGVMLSIVCLDLLSDAIAQVPDSVGHVFLVVAMTAVGFVLIYVLNAIVDRRTNPQVKHIDKHHPKTADQLSELIHSDHYEEHKKEYEQTKKQKSRRQLFIAGLATAIVIGLHNVPEGMAVSVSLVAGGMKKWKATILTAITGAPTILGAMLGYFLGTLSPSVLRFRSVLRAARCSMLSLANCCPNPS